MSWLAEWLRPIWGGPVARTIELRFVEKHDKRLGELKEQTGASTLTEVIRRAIAVYDFLCSVESRGRVIAVLDQDGSIEEKVSLVPTRDNDDGEEESNAEEVDAKKDDKDDKAEAIVRHFGTDISYAVAGNPDTVVVD